jgi:hypothetical protein
MSEGTIVGLGESCFVSYRVTKIESQRRAKSRDTARGTNVKYLAPLAGRYYRYIVKRLLYPVRVGYTRARYGGTPARASSHAIDHHQ